MPTRRQPAPADDRIGLDVYILGFRTQTFLDRRGNEQNLTEVEMERTISTSDLKAKMDRKDSLKVVETLAPERYRQGHLPGALNIPLENVRQLATQFLPNKDVAKVTYCANGH
jgi:phage shock protein E